jgi:hypothetical protein
LYHLLLEKHVVISEPNPRDVSLLQDEDEERKRHSRFTDDVFETLDEALWNEPPRKLRPLPSSLLEPYDERRDKGCPEKVVERRR